MGSEIDSVRNNMSLVYAKKSDEIGGVFRVCFACFYMRPYRVVQSYLMYLTSRFGGYACMRVYILT